METDYVEYIVRSVLNEYTDLGSEKISEVLEEIRFRLEEE